VASHGRTPAGTGGRASWRPGSLGVHSIVGSDGPTDHPEMPRARIDRAAVLVVLRGRRTECETLDVLLGDVRAGESRALALRGEPGVGKTALLEHLIVSAPDFRLVRAVGVEPEMELAFAALQQLCAPLLDGLEELPAPQRDALRVAFGLSPGDAPDRYLVGLATLSLLSEAGQERPLLWVVDDAHWLDEASAQVLAFVARRLLAESVALVLATREPSEEFRGLPELVVEGLRPADARALLASVVTGPLDERVCERIVYETRGNPLALLELPRGLTPAELAGGFGLPEPQGLSGRIEEGFRRRLDALPAETRRLLLVAAAEPVGDPVLVWRAAERVGSRVEAADPAVAAGLVEFGARVRFRHPLVRSTVYREASLEERQRVHGALAEVTDSELDPDRRAWHHAAAAQGPDEDVAAELERSAGRAQARGGLAAAAAFQERAAGLTLDPARRAPRALAAAQAKHHVGASDAALELLATAEAGPLDEIERARADVLRAQIAFASRRGSDAPPLLLEAAKRLEPLDLRLARDTYLEALSAAMFSAHLAVHGGPVEVARTIRAGPQAPEPPRVADLLLDGLALLMTEGARTAAPTLRRASSYLGGDDVSMEEELRWLWMVNCAVVALWDAVVWRVLANRHAQLARDAGALAVLPLPLSMRIVVHIFEGELAEAASLTEEVRALTEATGTHLTPYGGLMLAAWRGRQAEAAELIDACLDEAASRREGVGLLVAWYASAVLHNGLGRYSEARYAANEASRHFPEPGVAQWALAELVEAATRSERPEVAADALRRLAALTSAADTDWALGIEARSRALLADGEVAERLYLEAINRLDRTIIRAELARAHLLYGEWLRRERRRLDAREQLRTAHDMFSRFGADAFAERAARELLATGETARKRTVETGDQLTAQEAQIARLARDGLSNPAIGARLFISPRTVQYHLHKVFAKLDITRRSQLGRVPPSHLNPA
jgi:DNA-binding CsgD family transcriptional regulator